MCIILKGYFVLFLNNLCELCCEFIELWEKKLIYCKGNETATERATGHTQSILTPAQSNFIPNTFKHENT